MNEEPTQPLPVMRPEPPRPSRVPWVVAGVAGVLALVLGVTAAWAYQRQDPAVPGLRSELDKARADLANAQAQLEAAQSDAGNSADQVASLQSQVTTLTRRLKGSVPGSKLPVVVFERAGLGDQALFDSFQTNLVDPMVAWYSQQGVPPLVAVVIEIPENEGDPYVYRAVGLGGTLEEALFGTRGEPLPTWSAPCNGSDC